MQKASEPTRRSRRRAGRVAREGIQYPRWYWPSFALPGVLWLLIFFLLPLYTVVSIALAPSYSTATAVVRDVRKVAPYKAGRRLGKAISGTEQSRIQLHRLGATQRFVVWRVSPIK